MSEPRPRTHVNVEPYYSTAAEFLPAVLTLEAAQEASAHCKGCHLWKVGTQTVFGEGASDARIMLVGEQPGDKEDVAGHPFVGPAGRILDEALEEAGIDRMTVYVTNVVKHFKWVPVGGRRLHQKPNRKEVVACKPWLDAEISLVNPEIVVLLGATAAQAILGPSFKLTQHRGEFVDSELKQSVLATLHPSAVLRMRDSESRRAALDSLISDLRLVAKQLS